MVAEVLLQEEPIVHHRQCQVNMQIQLALLKLLEAPLQRIIEINKTLRIITVVSKNYERGQKRKLEPSSWPNSKSKERKEKQLLEELMNVK